MANGLRSMTPPMAIVKEEENLASVQSSNRTAQGTVALAAAPSVSSLLDTEQDLELPPRMRSILEEVIRTQPERVKTRYDEFLEVEKRAASKLVQNSSQVKLYRPITLSFNQVRTRIFIQLWAEKIIAAERQR
jgi:hypothetical protein